MANEQTQKFNVVEITGGPKAGRVCVVRCRRPGFRLQLRNASYLLCCVSHEFADGFACGIITERRRAR